MDDRGDEAAVTPEDLAARQPAPRDGRLHLYISPDAFADAAGMPRENASKLLGEDEERWLTPAEAQQLEASLDELLSR